MAARKPAAQKPASKAKAASRKPAAKKPPARPKAPSKPKAPPKPKAETKPKNPGPKKPGPEPKHPDPQKAEDIKVMVACGFEHARIARILKISTSTMHKYYKDELELGGDMANFEIGGTIFQAAKRGEKWACALWAARRMNWSETIEHKGTLNVNRVNLRAPDMPMPDEDPGETYGTEDEDEDFDEDDLDEFAGEA